MALFGSHTKKLREARDVAGLLAIAADPEAKHRSSALVAVIELVGDEGASSPFAEETSRVIRPLVVDPDPAVRALAVGALSLVKDPSAGSLAIEALHDPQPRVQVAGLIAIANLNPPGAINEVLAKLDESDELVRAFAASALRLIGDRSLVPMLRDRADRERSDSAEGALREAIATLEGEGEPPDRGTFQSRSEI
jgi:HEAT repeat protein